MKTCRKCDTKKDLILFSSTKNNKDGLSNVCKKCDRLRVDNYQKTKIGVIKTIYNSQVSSSKDRGHLLPTYSKQELLNWLLNDWLFDLLYTNWCNCGYISSIKPSIDRLDDSKGYSFDNIQVKTWGENKAKGHSDSKTIKLSTGRKKRAVLQYLQNGELVNEFISVRDAGRKMKMKASNISACCGGIKETYYGYIWKYKEA